MAEYQKARRKTAIWISVHNRTNVQHETHYVEKDMDSTHVFRMALKKKKERTGT